MGDLIQAAGLVLLTRSRPQQLLLLQHPDRWDLPKGHSDDGEDLRTTALRETEEETGISQDKIQVDDRFQFVTQYSIKRSKRGAYRKKVTYFLGYLERPEAIRLTEHIGYRWIDWPTTDSIQKKTIDPLLAQLRSYLGQPSTAKAEAAELD
jgi:bis(5'-nucleosidyl)-tetraphosphatase